MKRAGFFREFSYAEPSDPSIRDAVGKIGEDRDVVLRVLDAGVAEVLSPGMEVDVLKEGKYLPPLTLDTDGDWLWPSHLSYYVREYGVRPSESFIEHCRQRASLRGGPSDET